MMGLTTTSPNFVGKNNYDSRNPRPQIALNRDPAHHNVLQVQGGAIITNAGIDTIVTETLFSMKHNLGYQPKVLVYFLNRVISTYEEGTFIYTSGGAGDDYLTYSADTNNFSIIHVLTDPFSIGRTSTAPSFGNIQAKYSILSMPVNNYTDPTKR